MEWEGKGREGRFCFQKYIKGSDYESSLPSLKNIYFGYILKICTINYTIINKYLLLVPHIVITTDLRHTMLRNSVLTISSTIHMCRWSSLQKSQILAIKFINVPESTDASIRFIFTLPYCDSHPRTDTQNFRLWEFNREKAFDCRSESINICHNQ
jgi:hypothetical protein